MEVRPGEPFRTASVHIKQHEHRCIWCGDFFGPFLGASCASGTEDCGTRDRCSEECKNEDPKKRKKVY